MIKVIKASAGSGKTYQLTYEYIKMLLGVKRKGRYVLANEKDRERHRHILAVTFTNKATAEMKERIVKELMILKGHYPDKKSEYIDDLCRDFGNVSPEEVQKAAHRAVEDILYDYTNFNVSTIDAFFQMILRTFAKELKMSYNYEVEIDDDHAIKVGMFDMFSSLAHSIIKDKSDFNRALRTKAWLKEFSKDEVVDGGNWNVFRVPKETRNNNKKNKNKTFTLKKFMECLKKEDLRGHLTNVVEYIDLVDADNKYYISSFKEKLYEMMEKCKDDIIKARNKFLSIGESEDFYNLNSNGGLIWIKNLDKDLYKILPKIREKNIGNPEKWYLTRRVGKNKILLSDDAVSRMTHQFNRIKALAREYYIYKDIHRNIYMLGLLGEVKRYMEEYRKENEMILLGDTNDLLQRIINKEDTPFIYERVGVWLSHFLIDEFQDTSRAQWKNIMPLLFNSCAEGSDNLIIGDEKQCIYRFRNADPSLLRSEVGRNFTVKQNDGKRSFNWRSMPEVVNFNNDFFKTLASDLRMMEEYQNVEQDIPKKKKHPNKGYVEVNIIDEAAENEKNNEAETEETVAIPKLTYDDIVLSRMISVIKDLKSRGYRNKDIAVLVFANSQGEKVVQHLLNYNNQVTLESDKINVISDESLKLNNCSSVRLIISHLRYLDSKLLLSDEDAETVGKNIKERMDSEGYVHRVLRRYEHLMHSEGIEPGKALMQSVNEVPRHENVDNLSLNSLLPDNTESFSIVSITEHIISQNISEHNLERDNAFIQAFQDCVLNFSNRPNPSIHEFLKWWDRGGNNTSVISPEGLDAINVLTIHKSKGLEYNCVILPFCNWSLSGTEEVVWVPKEIAEDTGLFKDMKSHLIPPVFPIMPNANMEINQSVIKDYCEELLKERVFDALNKTYVAFTRAVDEMYIFSKNKNTKDESEITDIRNNDLGYFLRRLPLVDNIYSVGEKGHYVPKDKDKEPEKVEPLDNEEKKDALPVTMPIYRVENIKLEYKVNDMVFNERQDRGIRLHKVMNRIRTKDDVDKALLYFKVRGIIPSACFDEDSHIIKSALKLKDVQWWFDKSNRVYNERTIIDSEGKEIRPDRFFITPDGRTVVVDYKFGRMTPGTIKDHSEQVIGYINALEKSGCKNVEGYLWFPLEGESKGAITKVK